VSLALSLSQVLLAVKHADRVQQQNQPDEKKIGEKLQEQAKPRKSWGRCYDFEKKLENDIND
jgi:hypothetical protein